MYVKSRLDGKLFNARKLFCALCGGFPVVRRHLKQRADVLSVLKVYHVANAAGFCVLKARIGYVLRLVFVGLIVYCRLELPQMPGPGTT